MYNLAICDDNATFLEALSSWVGTFVQQQRLTCICEKFATPLELLQVYERAKYPFDILLLDIDMPGLDGVSAARAVRAHDRRVLILFLTSREDRVFESFEVKPFRFIRKSIWQDELPAALEQAFSDAEDQQNCVSFRSIDGIIKLYWRDILYFEVVDRHVVLVTAEGRSEMAGLTLDMLEKLSVKQGFIRINRSVLVNAGHVLSVQELEMRMSNGVNQYMARKKKTSVYRQMLGQRRNEGLGT